jgi:hypothetical protein
MSAEKVNDIVWPWRTASEATGSTRPPRKAVLIEASVGLVVALLLYHKFHKPIIATVVITISSLVVIGGLAIPPLYAAIKRFGVFLGKFLGGLVTWVLLLPFFYTCFTIGRLVVVLSKKDPMERTFDASLSTYWTPRKPVPDLDQYRKQY